MTNRVRNLFAAIASVAAVGLLCVASAPVAGAKESRQIETEGEFVKFDAATARVTVKVLKPGKEVKGMPKLSKGKEAEFKVKPEGTVLTRTTVKLQDGTAGKFEDLQEGRKVKVFWIQDEADASVRFARSISVFVPAEEQGEDAE